MVGVQKCTNQDARQLYDGQGGIPRGFKSREDSSGLDGGEAMTSPLDIAPLVHDVAHSTPIISDYMELWDYASGARFRGFTATDINGEPTLFVFFDAAVIGRNLKQG